MDLHPKNSCAFVGWMALEPRKGGQQDNDPKFLLVLVGFDDLVAETLGNPIFLGDEELIFNIDVFFGIADEVDIGIHHRMLGLGLFQSYCPH